MSQVNHYQKAEELLFTYERLGPGAQILEGPLLLAEAQVHATLAVSDAARECDRTTALANRIGGPQ